MPVEVWGQESETTVYCAFCPRWHKTGPAQEMFALAREHREEKHPDLPPPTRRRRANLGVWRGTLNEVESSYVKSERARRLRLLGITVED